MIVNLEASALRFGPGSRHRTHYAEVRLRDQAYAPLRFRSRWVPVANPGGGLSMIVIFVAFVTSLLTLWYWAHTLGLLGERDD